MSNGDVLVYIVKKIIYFSVTEKTASIRLKYLTIYLASEKKTKYKDIYLKKT